MSRVISTSTLAEMVQAQAAAQAQTNALLAQLVAALQASAPKPTSLPDTGNVAQESVAKPAEKPAEKPAAKPEKPAKEPTGNDLPVLPEGKIAVTFSEGLTWLHFRKEYLQGEDRGAHFAQLQAHLESRPYHRTVNKAGESKAKHFAYKPFSVIFKGAFMAMIGPEDKFVSYGTEKAIAEIKAAMYPVKTKAEVAPKAEPKVAPKAAPKPVFA